MRGVKKTALAAILAALAVTVMYVGSLFGKIDIATAVIASLCVMITLGESGYGAAFAVYGVSAVLSFLLVPSKTAVALFAVLFGLYPVVKTYGESRLGRAASYVLKYAYVNLAVVGLFAITAVFFVGLPLWLAATVLAAANALLPLYDALLTGFMGFYYNKIRTKRL